MLKWQKLEAGFVQLTNVLNWTIQPIKFNILPSQFCLVICFLKWLKYLRFKITNLRTLTQALRVTVTTIQVVKEIFHLLFEIIAEISGGLTRNALILWALYFDYGFSHYFKAKCNNGSVYKNAKTSQVTGIGIMSLTHIHLHHQSFLKVVHSYTVFISCDLSWDLA